MDELDITLKSSLGCIILLYLMELPECTIIRFMYLSCTAVKPYVEVEYYCSHLLQDSHWNLFRERTPRPPSSPSTPHSQKHRTQLPLGSAEIKRGLGG